MSTIDVSKGPSTKYLRIEPPGAVLVALVLGLAACSGVVSPTNKPPDQKVIVTFDTGIPGADGGGGGRFDTGGGGRLDGGSGVIDAASKPGDPCPTGTCGGNSICVAAICREKCTQPAPGCNDRSSCPSGTTCAGASSFTDACFPATANAGDVCGNGALCAGGSVCVKVQTQQPRCLKLCKYGCAATQRCVKTSNNCSVCL